MIMYAEVCQDGQWHKVGKEFMSTYEELDGQLTDRVFDGRNKDLTSFLFDNCFMSSNPESPSEEIKKFMEKEIVYSLTLNEILGLDWEKEDYKLGYITEWQYKRLKENGIQPVNIIKDPFHIGNIVVSPFLMDMIIAHPSLRQDARYYIQYKYDFNTIKDQCEFFCNVSIPRLINLIPEGGSSEDVRIIFSF